MKRKNTFRWSSVFTLVITLMIVSAQIVSASCPVNTRASSSTTWAFCSMSSSFKSKVRTAISKWDFSDTYSYTEASSSCAYAFSWGDESFSSKGWGSQAGTTFLDFDGSGKVTSAISYFNTDKTWFDSSTDGDTWPSGQYDRGTMALHETGHWMYLHHPSFCSQNHPEAVMEVTNTTKTYLRLDDLDGLFQLGVLN